MTIVAAFVAFFYLPSDPTTPSRRFFGIPIRILSERQGRIAATRVIRDDPTKRQGGRRVEIRDILDALLDWRIYGHCVSAFLSS
jgi:hypothetical protein